jgi:hypothetical protein
MIHENAVANSVVRESIHAVRERLPFLPIMMFPQKNLLVAIDNTAEITVDIPQGAVLFMAKGISNANIVMSVGGDSGIDPATGALEDRGIFLHSGLAEVGPYYCGNLSALRFETVSAAVVFATLHFWTRLE